jgi:hypothetical protein
MAFKHLDLVSSTCLSLNNRVLYQIHWSLRGRVLLKHLLRSATGSAQWSFLMNMLKKWMKKLHIYYIHYNETGSLKMMALERNMDLEDEWEGCENFS